MQYRSDVACDPESQTIQSKESEGKLFADKLPRCKVCSTECENEEILEKHMTENHLTCKVCGTECENDQALQKHVNTEHIQHSFKCTLCEDMFEVCLLFYHQFH